VSPLAKSKSKAAFSHNVKAEIAAGKPQKQAVAIAYNTARNAPRTSSRDIVSGLSAAAWKKKQKSK
jgi:hypothetical protein